MPDLSVPGPSRLRAVDALAADTRSLLRRATKVQRQTADLGETAITEQGQLVVEVTERLLGSLEDLRRDERLLARQNLQGIGGDSDQP
ncbi:MAG: hypothetical protein ACRENX_11765 [Candidatus Dormibacteria bacterium]